MKANGGWRGENEYEVEEEAGKVREQLVIGI